MPFGVHDTVAVLVAQDATFRVAGAGGGKAGRMRPSHPKAWFRTGRHVNRHAKLALTHIV